MYKTKEAGHFTLFNRNGVYYYYIYVGRKRMKRSTGKTNYKAAYNEALTRLNEGTLYDRDRILRVTLSEYAAPFFISGICPYNEYMKPRGKGQTLHTMAQHRSRLENHILPYLGKMRLEDIDRNTVDKWMNDLPNISGLSYSSSNLCLVTLNLIMDTALREEKIKKNPCENVEPFKSDSSRRDAFTDKEVKQLIEAHWKYPIHSVCVRLAADTGMRINEIVGLRISRLHRDHIVVDTSSSLEDGLKSTKNGKARIVPITEELYQLLRSCCAGNTNLDDFVLKINGKMIAVATLEKEFREQKEALGIYGNKSFHSLRHYFNSKGKNHGVDLKVIQGTVGHSSDEMTELYYHADESYMNQIRELQKEIEEERRKA